jgi:hypothetical protein
MMMNHGMTSIRCLVALLVAAGPLSLALLSASALPVSAECDGPMPSFRHALSSAKRVVIGDVTAVQGGGLAEAGSGGRSSRFTIRVRYVVRGQAPHEIAIRDVPTQPCAPGLEAAIGDRIAIAFDATDFTPPIQVNAVAWIRGTPPDYPGIETTSVAEIYLRIGQSPPDTATIEPPSLTTSFPVAVGLLAAFAVGFILGWRRPYSNRSRVTLANAE